MANVERLAIMIGPKGRGSNMRALVEAARSGKISADLHTVVSPLSDSPAAVWAQENGVPLAVVTPGEEYGERLMEVLKGATILCLAGFTRLLPVEVLQAFPGRVLNIHPALLPKFGGKGMYGARVHAAVIEAGEAESGCSVHIVTEIYDDGPVVLQARCEVLPDDTPETLAARVLGLEHKTFADAVEMVIRG
jgi:phosphoribosylglycinamide formyltransferase-1